VDWERSEPRTAPPWIAAVAAVVLLAGGLALVMTGDGRPGPDLTVESGEPQPDDESADDDEPADDGSADDNGSANDNGSSDEEEPAGEDPPNGNVAEEPVDEPPADDRRTTPSAYQFDPPTVDSELALPGNPDLTLHVFDLRGRRLRTVDLSSGEVAVGTLEDTASFRQPPEFFGDTLALTLHESPRDSVYAYGGGLDGDPVRIGDDETVLGADEHGVWLYTPTHQVPGLQLRHVPLDGGEPLGTYELPVQAWPVGLVGDRIVISYFGSVVAHHLPTGTGQVLGHGQAFAAAGPYVAWVDCEGDLRCTLTSAPASGSGPTRRLPVEDSHDWFGGHGHSIRLSPDGRYLAVTPRWDRPRAPLTVVDMETADMVEIVDIPASDMTGDHLAPVWSPDAEWLFTPSRQGGVLAWHAPSAQTHHLPVTDGPPDAIAVQ
jgi:hypothetical protein